MVDAASHGEHRIAGPRLIAIVGPFQTGKTSLLEGLLARGGGVARQGSVREGTCVGDFGAEARAHQMSVEPNIAHVDYMGDRLTFFDCPGSVEFFDATRAALPVCDAAVVVCEADARKVQPLRVILRELEEMKIPRFLFLNKIDLAGGGVREALETASAGLAHAAAAAPDSAVGEGRRHRLRRSRARARVRLPRGGALGSRRDAHGRRRRREAGALFDAGAARRLRRRADGAVAERHRAAARQGVRRPRPRPARGPCRAAADGLGDARPRRHPAAQGAAPRSARHRGDAGASRRAGRGAAAGRDHPHHPHRPRRQAEPGAGAARRLRRRRDGDGVERRRGAHRRPAAADGRDVEQDRARRGRRHRRVPAAGRALDRRALQRGQERAGRGAHPRRRCRRRNPSRSASRTARTRPGSPPRSPR